MSLDKTKELLGLKIEECNTMADLRQEIDLLDQNLVEILALRQTYMDQAARIKKDRNSVRDNERVEDVVKKVLHHAAKVGVNPNFIENLYRMMIEWSINYEFEKFDEVNEVNDQK